MFVGGGESVIDFSVFGDGTCLEEFILNIVTFHATCTYTVAFYSPSKCQDCRYLFEIVFFKLWVIVTRDFNESHVDLSLKRSSFNFFF